MEHLTWRDWFGHYIGEALGVFLIVFFGDAVIFVAVLLGVAPDIVTVGLVWGFAVGIAVWAAASISGAHFNPGVTLAMALRRKFPWVQVIPYIISQILGGLLAATVLSVLYTGIIADKLAALGLTKGAPGSQLVSMIFVPYVPNPGMVGIGPSNVAAQLHVLEGWSKVSVWQGALGEFIATALLLVFILVLLEQRSTNAPISWFFPVGLGIGVMLLVVVEGPISMVSLNAARDLGPRIFLWLTGWGQMAFPGPRADWWVTSIAPTLGAIFGVYLYDFVLRPFMPKEKKPEIEAEKKPTPSTEKVPA
ncbi:MAG TPA: MIP/aquaporin family protein [Ktedonobacteraceae bacterium]|nr:MIP/aquaporin family protein [Ktedonobacteraceae bacterium]